MTVFFTADHHFGHANIIKFCNRPFKSVEEMDDRLIRLWNLAVGPDDVVYHLGDFTLQGLNKLSKVTWQLNGRLKILPGSHDHRWLDQWREAILDPGTAQGHIVEVLPPLVSLEFPELGDCKHSLVIVLCHYAMRVWDRSHYGAWHLYGHSHGDLPGHGLSFDVGVDCTGFQPISLETVAQRMKALPQDHIQNHKP